MLVNNREQYRLDNFFSPFDASSASKAKLKLKPIHTVNKTKGKESRSNPQPAWTQDQRNHIWKIFVWLVTLFLCTWLITKTQFFSFSGSKNPVAAHYLASHLTKKSKKNGPKKPKKKKNQFPPLKLTCTVATTPLHGWASKFSLIPLHTTGRLCHLRPSRWAFVSDGSALPLGRGSCIDCASSVEQ